MNGLSKRCKRHRGGCCIRATTGLELLVDGIGSNSLGWRWWPAHRLTPADSSPWSVEGWRCPVPSPLVLSPAAAVVACCPRQHSPVEILSGAAFPFDWGYKWPMICNIASHRIDNGLNRNRESHFSWSVSYSRIGMDCNIWCCGAHPSTYILPVRTIQWIIALAVAGESLCVSDLIIPVSGGKQHMKFKWLFNIYVELSL